MPQASRKDRAAHNTRIENALAELNSQKRVNYAATARKWGVERTTLAKRHRGETRTAEEFYSDSRQKLNSMQEEVLLDHINKLSNRGIPPTPQILKNIAEEISGKTLGHNWVTRYIERYRDRITSVYLCGIDHKRKKADNSHYFKMFYDLVCVLPSSVSMACGLLLIYVY